MNLENIKQLGHNIETHTKDLTLGLQMVYVEGGVFEIKSEGTSDCERIPHNVTLNNYAIAKHQVTQALWTEVMGSNPSKYQGAHRPIEKVNIDDIKDFLKKLNAKYPNYTFRLPTEEEWEYAAKGGKKSKGYIYAGSDDIDEVCWCGKNSYENKTRSVGIKKPNELGIYDMSGNVWEWCLGWANRIEANTNHCKIKNEDGLDQVLRGGAFDSSAKRCSIENRYAYTKKTRSHTFGFRLAFSMD